jgi:hypothetical protein
MMRLLVDAAARHDIANYRFCDDSDRKTTTAPMTRMTAPLMIPVITIILRVKVGYLPSQKF